MPRRMAASVAVLGSGSDDGSDWDGGLSGSTGQPNVISYSAAISACEKGVEPEQALELLREMLRSAPARMVCSPSRP